MNVGVSCIVRELKELLKRFPKAQFDGNPASDLPHKDVFNLYKMTKTINEASMMVFRHGWVALDYLEDHLTNCPLQANNWSQQRRNF